MTLRWIRVLLLLTPFVLPAVMPAADDDDPTDEAESPPQAGKLSLVLNIGGHSAGVNQLEFGRLGRRLYKVGGGEVQEWQADLGERLRVWRFPGLATRIAMAPDYHHLAVAGFGRTDAAGSKKVAIWMIPLPRGEPRIIATVDGDMTHRLAFSPDGKRLAVAGVRYIRILSLVDKTPPVDIDGTGVVHTLAFSPDGHLGDSEAARRRRRAEGAGP